jgi:hypothetical protein
MMKSSPRTETLDQRRKSLEELLRAVDGVLIG